MNELVGYQSFLASLNQVERELFKIGKRLNRDFASEVKLIERVDLVEKRFLASRLRNEILTPNDPRTVYSYFALQKLHVQAKEIIDTLDLIASASDFRSLLGFARILFEKMKTKKAGVL